MDSYDDEQEPNFPIKRLSAADNSKSKMGSKHNGSRMSSVHEKSGLRSSHHGSSHHGSSHHGSSHHGSSHHGSSQHRSRMGSIHEQIELRPSHHGSKMDSIHEKSGLKSNHYVSRNGSVNNKSKMASSNNNKSKTSGNEKESTGTNPYRDSKWKDGNCKIAEKLYSRMDAYWEHSEIFIVGSKKDELKYLFGYVCTNPNVINQTKGDVIYLHPDVIGKHKWRIVTSIKNQMSIDERHIFERAQHDYANHNCIVLPAEHFELRRLRKFTRMEGFKYWLRP